MSEIKCFEIDGVELFLEQTLIEVNYPVLYTCRDSNKNRYIAMCVNIFDGYYLVGSVSLKCLIEMLTAKITMRDIFKRCQCIYKVTADPEGDFKKDTIKKVEYSSISEKDLPVIGANFKILNDEVKNYVDTIKSLNDRYMLEETYTKIFDISKQMQINIQISKKRRRRTSVWDSLLVAHAPEYYKVSTQKTFAPHSRVFSNNNQIAKKEVLVCTVKK